jgi:NADPH-dependent 2,4-dienoyl-CoA reductase/sulfur reductase-like enzyme
LDLSLSSDSLTIKRDSEVLVVGAGPAGLAAAIAASRAGRKVLVVDDNAAPGGQIWRNGAATKQSEQDAKKTKTLREFRRTGAELLAGRRVIDAPDAHVLRVIVESAGGATEDIRWQKLILATGARERFLPFPGWTLPGVFGAGGLQALVKGGFSVQGKRLVVAGTGPLLLAVAFHLQQEGAAIAAIAEQAPIRKMADMAAKLWSHPSKVWQGLGYRIALGRASYRIGCWPVEALGEGKLSAVRLTNGKESWIEDCDLLACGFHLVPNTELALMLGCTLRGDVVSVDADQRSSVADIYCAGEPTGIAGLDAALVQGEIAGRAAAGERIKSRLRRRREHEGGMGRMMDRAFALRPEVLSLASADTIVCRCEDVEYTQLQGRNSWTDAKLQTRCGMGACQGRVCGPAVEAMFGWKNASVRPPLYPVPISAICGETEVDQPELPTTQETL